MIFISFDNHKSLRACSDIGAIFSYTEITITTSYRGAIAVDKSFFTIAVDAIPAL